MKNLEKKLSKTGRSNTIKIQHDPSAPEFDRIRELAGRSVNLKVAQFPIFLEDGDG